MFTERATFLILSGTAKDRNKKHLQILLTNPFGQMEEVLLVSVCSIENKFHDNSCLLNKGDHNFINHPSYVAYEYSDVRSVASLQKGIADTSVVPQALLSEAVFARVVEGFNRSKRVKRFAKDFFGKYTYFKRKKS